MFPGRTRSLTASILLALITVTIMLFAGCAPKLVPEPAWEKDARALLDQADSQFQKKQYDLAARTVEVFFSRFPSSRHQDRAFYLLGESRLAQRDYPRALSYYKEILEKYPSSALISSAKYRLGQCYFEIREYDLAIANLQDRSKITDPAWLKRAAEMLAAAYVVRKNYATALKEYLYLAEIVQNEKQRAGHRDAIREIVEKNLTEDELRTLSDQSVYPADIAQLRLAKLLIDQRQYRDAVKIGKRFIETFPMHPEKTRGEMLINEATAKLSSPKYYIAALLPQSGQLAFFGDRVLKGVQLAVHTHNLQDPDNRVELLVKDTEGSPEKAVAALTALASDGIIAAIGPLLTKEAEALVPILEKLKIPVITPAASGEGLGKASPWIFRNALTNSTQAAAAAQFALGLKLKKIVIFYPDDAYGKDLTRAFTRELERRAEILATVEYPPDVKDFGPYIRRVMEIDLRSRKILIPEDDAERKKLLAEYTPSFDGLYLPGHAERVGLLIPQLAFYNIQNVTMIGSNNWHSNDLIERAGRHVEGAVFIDGFFPESADPVIKPVMDAYRSAYQEEPDILSAQAYDSAMMVLSLLKERKDTPLLVRDGLLAIKGYQGVSGVITFPGTGEAQKKLFLITVQDGQFAPYRNGK
jgi:ABC-type branched-subunit amino acid transport system substrate-binding protein